MNGVPDHDSDAVLRLQDLSVDFITPHGPVAAVRGISLSVRAGECLGVVGESGAGKSQAFLAVLGLLDANARVGGQATFGRRELIGLTSQQLDEIRGLRVGMVFQDPMTSLTPHRLVGDQIAEPLVRHVGVTWREGRLRALALLRRVRMTDPERRMKQYPHELSGGMRQRVMLAIALSCEPRLLIADEPTTALDVTVQAQILAVLADLKRERAMAMVLITHDLGVLAGLADRVAVMQAGRIVEADSVSAILRAPRHPYTQALVAAVPRLDERAAGSEPTAPAGQAAVSGPAPLEVCALCVDFAGGGGVFGSGPALRAINDVSFALQPAEALGIVGESGSGKSTLVRAVLHLIRPVAGRVVWLGRAVEDVAAGELRRLRRQVQIVFQDPLSSLDPRMTVAQIIAEPLRVQRPELDRAQRRTAIENALCRVGLAVDLSSRYPRELSGGQCQRVGIARALVLEPRILVCDEAVSALDVSVQRQIVDLLAALKRDCGLSIVFVSHNLAVVKRLCERVLVLYLGRMMEMAPSTRLYDRPLHPYTRELLGAVPVIDPQVQPGRFARSVMADLPSPLHPPSGCVFRTRCPHAIDLCRQQRPDWEVVEGPAPQTDALSGPDCGLAGQGAGAPRATPPEPRAAEPEANCARIACHRWRELATP